MSDEDDEDRPWLQAIYDTDDEGSPDDEDLPPLLDTDDDEYDDAEGADSTAIVTWPVPLPHGRNGTVGFVTLSPGSGKTTILGSIRRSYSILE